MDGWIQYIWYSPWGFFLSTDTVFSYTAVFVLAEQSCLSHAIDLFIYWSIDLLIDYVQLPILPNGHTNVIN